MLKKTIERWHYRDEILRLVQQLLRKALKCDDRLVQDHVLSFDLFMVVGFLDDGEKPFDLLRFVQTTNNYFSIVMHLVVVYLIIQNMLLVFSKMVKNKQISHKVSSDCCLLEILD